MTCKHFRKAVNLASCCAYRAEHSVPIGRTAASGAFLRVPAADLAVWDSSVPSKCKDCHFPSIQRPGKAITFTSLYSG